jgi:tetratricopeptide (TPR) repeat protein
MKKIPLLLGSILLTLPNLFSQNKTEDFVITLPEQKIPNSLYKTISFIDSRYDTTNMGIVQLGVFNRKARVVPKTHFSEQLKNVLNALTDSTSKDGELLFQLRQFNFAEITGSLSEKGYCYLRADLYAKTNDQYQKTGSIDTVILVKAGDVTRAMFRNGSKTITNFIGSNLLQSPTDAVSYSYNDVMHIDSIEKRRINVYNAAGYKDGAYKDFQSFARQEPDYDSLTVTFKDGKIDRVKTPGEDGKMTTLKAKNMYALVHQGQIFIVTEYGDYPVEKRNDDFYFIGKAKVSLSTGDAIAAGLFFGIMGQLMAEEASQGVFEMKIDHINGGFIRLREVKQYVQ